MFRIIGSLTVAVLLLGGCGGGGGASAPSPPVVAAGSPPDGGTGMAYPGYTFAVASGGVAPFTWSETGTLPPGLALSSAGQLTGTPATAGIYSFTVQVADASMPPLTGSLTVSALISDSSISLSYSVPLYVEVGSATGPWPPSISGGSASAFAVIPALPAGLSLDPNSGVIGGTPQAAAPQGAYHISAQIAGSRATFDLDLTVEAPPTVIYTSPVRAVVGTPLGPLVPSLSGTVNYFNISMGLPAGLQFDPSTGVVSGTPTSARVQATYTIVANNDLASTSADLVLAVDPPPAGTPMTGVFRGATVIGLGYDSGAKAGVTDSSGQFTYESGRAIAFHVGGVVLGAAPLGKPLLTPVDLVANGGGSSGPVLNRVRFLMMLDQDGDPRNGIQISPAVTAAAASWAPVDFNTTDLPAALGAVIQQARTADGGSHALPDAASAQAFLRAAYACAYSGDYQGTYATDATPGVHGPFDARLFPDGSMKINTFDAPGLTGFSIASADAVNPLLDGTVAVITPGSSLAVQGRFSDPSFLVGAYLAGEAGTFEAAGGAELGPTYLFFPAVLGTPGDPATAAFSGHDPLTMDGSGNVTGSIPGGYLTGVVAGADVTGTVSYYKCRVRGCEKFTHAVTGTVSNTIGGYELDLYAGAGNAVVYFTALGCRVN